MLQHYPCKCNLTEKKLFSYMYIDAGVVEAEQIINKMTTETGFPCNLTI